MAKKRKSAVEEEMELNMTPMIDVTFQLLIFFIVTLKFKTLEKKLNSYLPTDLGLNASNEIVEDVFITVKLRQPLKAVAGRSWRSPKKTKFLFESEEITGSSNNALREIKKRLKLFRAQQPEAKGKIDAAFGVPHMHVVGILDVFHAVGYETISFTGLAKNSSIVKNEVWFNRIQQELRP
ncbi:MAG: biopolymer transporter ExbD [Planctomycetota bacterium]